MLSLYESKVLKQMADVFFYKREISRKLAQEEEGEKGLL